MNRLRDRWWVLLSVLMLLPAGYLYTSAFEAGADVNRAQAFVAIVIGVVGLLCGAHALLNWFDRNGHLFNEQGPHGDPRSNGH